MSWNNASMEKKFQEEQLKLRKFYEENGMTEEQIDAMYEYDLEDFHNTRNREEVAETIGALSFPTDDPLYIEAEAKSACEFVYEDHDIECGFSDVRLQKIWRRGDKKDRTILILLSQGYSKGEIAQKMHITASAVSKRLLKMKKF